MFTARLGIIGPEPNLRQAVQFQLSPMALHVTAQVEVAAASYWGFGIYFTDCMDASAYSAVKFTLKGSSTVRGEPAQDRTR